MHSPARTPALHFVTGPGLPTDYASSFAKGAEDNEALRLKLVENMADCIVMAESGEQLRLWVGISCNQRQIVRRGRIREDQPKTRHADAEY